MSPEEKVSGSAPPSAIAKCFINDGHMSRFLLHERKQLGSRTIDSGHLVNVKHTDRLSIALANSHPEIGYFTKLANVVPFGSGMLASLAGDIEDRLQGAQRFF
jgi:hypothetical protein